MSTEYEAVIGLEIHVQLSTKTKMFCGCELSFGDEPNVHTCPVCLALPGVLPVPNRTAFEYALKIGAALGCELPAVSTFDRKNYFYPDNPKAYQITQAVNPFAVDGRLGEVRIHHAHLEEDAAKTIHTGGGAGRIQGSDASLVDFNRGGTPLVEIVTEPDLHSGAQVREWGQLLRATIKQLGVSDVNMEEGSLRCDANVSIRPVGSDELGTKTEMKNMNSFRFIERGIDAEIARQKALVEAGQPVVQETLHFDPSTGELHSLRSKEEAHDYRYLPEPDLVPVVPTQAMLDEARNSLPELPAARAARYEEIGVSEQAALLLSFETEWAEYFEGVLAARKGVDPRVAANWVTGEFAAELRKQDDQPLTEAKVEPDALAALIGLVAEKKISHGAGKTVLEEMVASGADPVAVVADKGLEQISDSGELEKIVIQAIEDNPKPAEQVRSGNEKAIGALVGAVMKATQGRADGGEVNRLLRQHLGL